MPRKSTRAQATEVPEGERRVTRRSLQPKPAPEPPKPAAKAAPKPKAAKAAASPARGRGRGRGAARGKKAKKDEEEEEPEEMETEETPEESETKEDAEEQAAGDAPPEKPAKGRGRGRGKAAAAAAEPEPVKDTEEDKADETTAEPEEKSQEEDVEAKEEKVTPRKGRGKRSAAASPAKAETPPSSGRASRTRSPRKLPEETPTRRSGRSRRSTGAEEEAASKDEEEEQEDTEPTGKKRKREDDETEEVAEKKQKVEETEADSTEAPKSEETMEVEEAKTAEPVSSETNEKVEVSNQEKDEAKSKGKVEEKPEEKVEPANYPSKDEPEKKVDAAMDTSQAKEEKEPDISEYVLVNKEEVPAADSAEVTSALPKEVKEQEKASPVKPTESPVKQQSAGSNAAQAEPTSQPVSVIQEPVSAQASQAAPVQPTENGEKNGDSAGDVSMETDNKPAGEPSNDKAAPSNNVNSVAQDSGATIPDPLFQRQYVANPNIDSTAAGDSARKFSVVSYNILADCHTSMSKYPWIAPDHLSQEYRHKKLLQELQYLDADIVCLQEVGKEYYENALKPTLSALGYEGSYMKRIDDNMAEGEATFVRTSRFTVLSQKGLALRDLAFKELANSGLENGNLDAVKKFVDKPSVLLISQLKCNNTGSTVTVGNIHVSWEQLSKPDLQCIEVADALKELVATATPQGAFLICGDFNSWPGTSVYQLTKEGYLSDQSVSELQGVNNVRMGDGSLSPLINLWWKGFQHTATNMKSAYHQVLGNEPHTTRYPHNGWVKQVDFVWYSGNTLNTVGVLQAVNQDKLSPGIPNASFPSDHVSLKTDLVLKQ